MEVMFGLRLDRSDWLGEVLLLSHKNKPFSLSSLILSLRQGHVKAKNPQRFRPWIHSNPRRSSGTWRSCCWGQHCWQLWNHLQPVNDWNILDTQKVKKLIILDWHWLDICLHSYRIGRSFTLTWGSSRCFGSSWQAPPGQQAHPHPFK